MTYIPQTELARGTTLSWTPNGTGAPLVAFLSLVTATPAGNQVGEVENVLLTSIFKPYLPTLPEAEGTFTIQHWDGDAGCVAMQAAVRVAPVPLGTFLITLPSGATLSVPGFPKGYSIQELGNEEIITAEIPYRATGPTTYTAPA